MQHSPPQTTYRGRLFYEPVANPSRLARDVEEQAFDQYDAYWKTRPFRQIPADFFSGSPRVWLDIGAGSGHFFSSLAAQMPDVRFVAIERCRMRAQTLQKKAARLGLANFSGIRGNIIPAMINAIPPESLERIYILYPCPWPKNSQRKNRWYLHPIMPYLVRSLIPGGLLIWASDQKFYIDEAKWICESHYPLETMSYGPVSPNDHNELQRFPVGRTKFEQDFLSRPQPCFELISRKAAGRLT